jgi:hypothetical protein
VEWIGLDWIGCFVIANNRRRAVQVRAFKDVDLDRLKLNKIDGKSV